RSETLFDDAFALLDELENQLSLYRPESDLSRLNRTGALDSAGRHLLAVLGESARMSRATQGAFDVTIQPLWRAYADQPTLPTAELLAAARAKVDYRRVQVTGRSVRLAPGAEVTLNGIAQGYALDRVRELLRSRGVINALIDTGELGALGVKDGSPWRTGIQHPVVEDALAAVTPMDHRCIATSGDYATTFTADRRLHHLLDPRTGVSPPELSSVTVVAPTGVLADALSTAVFVLGPERGLKLVSATPDADAMLIAKQDAKVWTTAGFPRANS
ncbi:MAG: FAD:protein FMN transferase, partial [Planctomycetales bacterium]|nr:FAD:protein FMN transferase [Planctomycetales bacterium]